MIVRPRDVADARPDPLLMCAGVILVLFLVSASQNNGNPIEGVRMEAILFHGVEDVEIDAEEPFPLEERKAVEESFAEGDPCLLKHRRILTDGLSLRKTSS